MKIHLWSCILSPETLVVFMKGRGHGYKISHYMYSHFSCVIRTIKPYDSILASVADKWKI